MFDKYKLVYVNTIDEYKSCLNNGCHPESIICEGDDILAYLKDHYKESDDLTFAYAIELAKDEGYYSDEQRNIFHDLINKSYIPAYTHFAIMELNRLDVSKEDEEIFYEYLSAAVKAGDTIAKFFYGERKLSKFNEFTEDDNPDYYLGLIKESAGEGYAFAQNSIGEGIIDSLNIAEQKEGIYWLTLAANQEDIRSLNTLASCYLEGNVVERDVDKAFSLYEISAKHNDIEALLNLGKEYLNTENNHVDSAKAFEYFKKAADLGDSDGDFYCGLLCLNDEGKIYDTASGIMYLTAAGEQGDGRAYDILGDLYFTGDKIEKDDKKAYEMFSLSASLDYDFGKYHKAYCLVYGVGIEKDVVSAVEILKEASNDGSTDAMIFLAELYMDGTGVKKNIDSAIKLLKKASVKDKDAFKALGDAYLEKAIASYKKVPKGEFNSKKVIKELKKVLDDDKDI